MKMSGEMAVEATPEEFFDFIADPQNEAGWNPDLKSIRRLDGGPLQPGAEWDGDYRGMGTMRIRLDDCERPRRVVFSTVGSRMEMDFVFDIAPSASGVAVTMNGEARPKGAMRALAPLLGSMMRRTMAQRPQQMSEGLRTWRESRPQA